MEKKVKFCGIFRDKIAEKSAGFVGIFAGTLGQKAIGKKMADFAVIFRENFTRNRSVLR